MLAAGVAAPARRLFLEEKRPAHQITVSGGADARCADSACWHVVSCRRAGQSRLLTGTGWAPGCKEPLTLQTRAA
jgi:hypothetical protein